MGKNNRAFSDVEILLLGNDSDLGNSLLLVLSWLAGSDGSIDQSERQQLLELAQKAKVEQAKAIITLGRDRDVYALQLASELLRDSCSEQQAELFIQLAVSMASADGTISQEEVRIIEYLCDVLGISHQTLQTISRETIRRPFPSSYDLSQASFWERFKKSSSHQQDRGSHRQDQESGPRGQRSGSATNAHTQDEILAFGLLGLDPGASQEEIKKSYRRMAKVHHPDRFATLGEEAMKAATQHFQKIHSAYELLSAGGRA